VDRTTEAAKITEKDKEHIFTLLDTFYFQGKLHGLVWIVVT
jgi:hypothetical protein